MAGAGCAAVAGLVPLPQRSPTLAPRGHLSPAPLLLFLLTPLTWNRAWGFPRWGSWPPSTDSGFPFLFSVQGAPLQSGGVGLRRLHHAHRGVLQEQGRSPGSGKEDAQLTQGPVGPTAPGDRVDIGMCSRDCMLGARGRSVARIPPMVAGLGGGARCSSRWGSTGARRHKSS